MSGKTGALRRVGQAFRELAEQVPDYFATSKELPPPSATQEEALSALAKKHGVVLSPAPEFAERPGTIMGGMPGAVEDYDVVYAAPSASAREYSPLTRAYANAGDFSKDADVFALDASNVLPGSGVSKRVTPALYEYIVSRGGHAANIVDSGLSPANRYRRNANMAGVIEKYGPQADRLFIVDPDQIRARGDAVGSVAPGAYRLMLPEEKIGLLNSMLADDVENVSNSIVQRYAKRAEDPREAHRFLGQLQAQGLLDRNNNVVLDITNNPDHYPALAKHLNEMFRDVQGTGGAYTAYGADSLRRAALAKAFKEGMTAKDVSSSTARPVMTRHLARAEGGSVRSNTQPG